MKLKYKLIIVFIIIIVSASLPISLYILEREESERIELITHQGSINSKILSKSTLNLLLMNGGDVETSRVDVKEMISMLQPLMSDGLIYADAILLSPNPRYNGVILASLINRKIIDKQFYQENRVSAQESKRLKGLKGLHDIELPGINHSCFEIVASSSIEHMQSTCVGRLIFSKSMIGLHISRLRNMVYGATFSGILLASLLGFLFSRFFSKPIENLTEGVAIIGSGDLDYRIPMRRRDEIGRLATTFNHLAQVIKLEISELQQTNRELTRLDRLKDEFLANITHELRTPLYGMIGIAESLMDGIAGDQNNDTMFNLSLMVSSGKRLSGLVNDILDFSRLQHEDIDLDLQVLDLQSIANLIISLTRPLLDNKSIQIKTTIQPETYYIYADENRLQQIMLNIVGNAIKFTEEGEVLISAEPDPNNEENLIISITDTGIGIPYEKQDIIFESFEQVDSSISRQFVGAGLGLAISKKLIELHGGKIWVSSAPEKGSCFSFTLKQCRDAETQQEVKVSVPYAPQKHLYTESFDEISNLDYVKDNVKTNKIMIVDDEPINLRVLTNHLTLAGYRVVTAEDGAEALQKIEEEELPDLVILDVMLPKISGYEVCSIIRKKYSLSQLPILMLTAKNRPGDIITGFEVGTNDYLTKPVDKKELIARVTGIISLKESIKQYNELNIIRREINIAHHIQNSILVKEEPLNDAVTIALSYLPMYELGGDFYEVKNIDESIIGILIADVSGHGIPAAFISAMLKVAFSVYHEIGANPAIVLENINRLMCEFTNGQFITACYALIDISEKKILYANAGHWPLVIMRNNQESLLLNRENGAPLGWVKYERYELYKYDLEEGDRIIFYTDGIIEARRKDDKMFGEERFHELIKNNRDNNAQQCLDNIIEQIETWSEISETGSLGDDITLIVADMKKV